MKPSKRLERIPPYAFAELERKIAAKRAAGVDVISLGIGDPDRPTPALIVEAMQEAVTEPETHRYPSNRGRADFRAAVRDFYERRFDVRLDPEREIIPAIGAKEAIFNLNLAFLDPGDYVLASDPGYPVYTGGPWLAGGEPVLMALQPERGFTPDLEAIDEGVAARARLMYINYPNNPTVAAISCARRCERSASTCIHPGARSTYGPPCPPASRARPPTASTFWSGPGWCCRPAPSTGLLERDGSASRSRRRTTACSRPSSGSARWRPDAWQARVSSPLDWELDAEKPQWSQCADARTERRREGRG